MRKEGNNLILTLDDYYYPWHIVFLEDLSEEEQRKIINKEIESNKK